MVYMTETLLDELDFSYKTTIRLTGQLSEHTGEKTRNEIRHIFGLCGIGDCVRISTALLFANFEFRRQTFFDCYVDENLDEEVKCVCSGVSGVCCRVVIIVSYYQLFISAHFYSKKGRENGDGNAHCRGQIPRFDRDRAYFGL